MNKLKHLGIAELIDSYRVIPRLFILACFVWTVLVTNQLLVWYTHLPKDERGFEASGFASIVFVAVVGFLKMVFTEYSKNGRDWNQQPVVTTTTATAVTSTETAPRT